MVTQRLEGSMTEEPDAGNLHVRFCEGAGGGFARIGYQPYSTVTYFPPVIRDAGSYPQARMSTDPSELDFFRSRGRLV